MNGYAAMALEHLQEFRPRHFARLEDPERYCATVGEQVEAEMMAAREDIRQRVPPDLNQADRLVWIGAARRLAEQRILAEKIFLPHEPNRWQDPEPQREDEIYPFRSLGTLDFHLVGSEDQEMEETSE